jgi:hypothetical protein
VKGLDSIVALGVIPDIHFSTLHFADQLNLFSKRGVAVKVTEFAGSTTGELARMLKDKKVEDIGNRLDRRPHLLYRKRGRRQDHLHVALLVLEVAADYAEHPVHVPLRTQRLPSTLPLSFKWPLLRMTSPTTSPSKRVSSETVIEPIRLLSTIFITRMILMSSYLIGPGVHLVAQTSEITLLSFPS